MRPDRRRLLQLSGASLALTAATPAAHAAPAPKAAAPVEPLVPNSAADQTAALQSAIDDASQRAIPLVLPAGTFQTQTLTLRSGSVITGAGNLTTLVHIGDGPLLTANGASQIRLRDLTFDGALRPPGPGDHTALIMLDACPGLDIAALTICNASRNGLAITGCSGQVSACTLSDMADAAIFALDSTLTICGNTLARCGNNGILVWRKAAGEDGSRLTGNRISLIRSDAGGSGQNGNGINVFRAGSVQVSGNTITGCAYSAIRGNAASNLLITGNHCERIGEVAIYAEFAFTGALIANNLVDTAATGISVTNFNEGGRLAVVQGNLIRNIHRREHEPVDKRGEGITVEADTLVSANTIENAQTCGIMLGWGRYMRDVTATGNLIRNTPVGILVCADKAAGTAIITANLISAARDGAIRAHDQGRAFGPDLAREPASSGRVTIAGNAVT